MQLIGSRRLRRVVAVVGATTAVVLIAGIAPASAAGKSATASARAVPVVSGLDNPRGLAVGGDGQFYVGEAGHGGSICFPGGPQGGVSCLGLTSRISRLHLDAHSHTPVVTGLLSVADPVGVGATGVDGISVGQGRIYGVLTLAPQIIEQMQAASSCKSSSASTTCQRVFQRAQRQAGNVIVASKSGSFTTLARVGKFDYNWIVAHGKQLDPNNPDFTPGDANPYGVLVDGDRVYVVDAGSNTLDRLFRNGGIRILTYFPNPPGDPNTRFPYDAVPTCLARTGNRTYVADLSGRVWIWNGRQIRNVPVPAGMHFNGCTSDRAGNVYVSSIFTQPFAPMTGSILKITPSGRVSTVIAPLNYPAGLAFGPGGRLYAAVNAICPARITTKTPPICPAPGQVVRITQSS